MSSTLIRGPVEAAGDHVKLKSGAATEITIQTGSNPSSAVFTLPAASTTLVGRDTTDTLTGKTIDGDSNTIQDLALSSLKTQVGDANKVLRRDGSGAVESALLVDANISSSAAIDQGKLAPLTPNKLVATNGGGFFDVTAVAVSDLDALSGIDGNIQDQLDDKYDASNPSSYVNAAGAAAAAPVQSVAGQAGTVVLAKGDVGLGNVNNTSDTNKPVSTATQTALDLKANVASPTFTGTVSGITKSMVGLGNVDNTSDATKNTATATLQNKIYDGGTASITSLMRVPKAALSVLTALGRTQANLFYDTTANRLVVDDGTSLVAVGTAASGLKTYVKNPNDAAANWTSSDVSKVTVATHSTASNLPDNSTQTTGIVITRVSGNDGYVYSEWLMDAVDYTVLGQIILDAKTAAAAGAYEVQLWTFTAANGGGTATQVTLSASAIPTGTSKFTPTGAAGSATAPYMRIYIVARTAAGTTPLYLNNVTYTPSVVYNGVSPDTDWASYSPTGAWNNTTYTGIWRRRGANIEIKIGLTLTGVPTGTLSFTVAQMLNGLNLTYNSSANASNANKMPWGMWTGVDTGTADYMGQFGPSDATSATPTCFLTYANGSSLPVASIAATTPFSWNTGDEIGISATFPIAEWAGQTLTQGASTNIEYAYNSSATTASDTTSFANGAQGVLIQAFAPAGTAAITKRVQFQSAIQPTDTVILEINTGSGIWFPFNQRYPGFATNDAGSIYYGYLTSNVSATQVDVLFFSQAYPGTAWSVLSTALWRLRKANPTAPVGVKAADANAPGYMMPRKGQYSLTVTNTAAGWSTIRAIGLYYQDQDGNHRLKFNITGTITSKTLTGETFTITGITIKNISSWVQACSGWNNGSKPVSCAAASPNTSTVSIYADSSTTCTSLAVSGDVELDSKPSWAT